MKVLKANKKINENEINIYKKTDNNECTEAIFKIKLKQALVLDGLNVQIDITCNEQI